MNLTISGHDDRYAVEQLLLALFPKDAPVDATSELRREEGRLVIRSTITLDGKTASDTASLSAQKETVRLRRQTLQQSMYLAARQLLPEEPAWGALAGVRPTKLSTRCLLSGGTPEDADRLLRDVYFVTPQRRELALACSDSTVRAISLLTPQDVSLYIGIPFCPTRCAYCSFVSRSVGSRTDLMEPYLAALTQEIIHTGALLRATGHTVRALYIGGGTPTTLSCEQMARLMETVASNFDLSRCLEYTVEGGRPDTLSTEKLRLIRSLGADRMSVNPQSMVDSVLRSSGRPHIASDILRAYDQAVTAGFDLINMDLIAGLPTDTFEGFRYSLDTVAALNPANLTVHTLALKKGADLFEKQGNLPSRQEVSRMIAYATETLHTLSYKPYYLYRQKYMSGSFENTGWSRNGTDCLYNICMMEEIHTIVSLGGGAMSKVNLPGGKICRFHNPKFPEQYIEGIDRVLEQKAEMFQLLKGSV